jgi:two-component system, NarL family, invasion response regulator UvrY
VTRILIADDHAVLRQGLKQILTEDFPDAEFGETGTVQETLDRLAQERWDVVVLDLFMPEGSGLQVLAAPVPKPPVLVLSSAPEEQMALRVMRAGAAGYLNKQVAPEELVKAVRQVLSGGWYLSSGTVADVVADSAHRPHEQLTAREFQVLQMIALGKSLNEIATELSLSPKTISTFHTGLLEKLGLDNDIQLTHYALDHGLIERSSVPRPGPH